MADWHPYADSITEAEQALGFIRVLVADPRFEFAYSFSLTPAVIRPLSDPDRIVKLNNPNGVTEYQHQAFGRHGSSSGREDWLPVEVSFSNPELAVSSAQAGCEERGDALNPQVQRSTPKLILRCPRCSHRFELPRAYLRPDEQIRCPSCRESSAAEQLSDCNT